MTITSHQPLTTSPCEDDIQSLLRELNLHDIPSLLCFGIKIQEQLAAMAEELLAGVQSQDLGPLGETLGAMLKALRELPLDDLDPRSRSGWWGKLLRREPPLPRLRREYDSLQPHLETIAHQLGRYRSALLKDIAALDRLQGATLSYFRTLEGYIAAAERSLDELSAHTLPAFANRLEAARGLIAAQQFHDLHAARDDLKQRIHELRATRTMVLPTFPSLRLVRDNDRELGDRLKSMLLETLPSWRQQLARMLAVQHADAPAMRSPGAPATGQEPASAEHSSGPKARFQTSPGRRLVDVEAARSAHRTLLEAVANSLRLAEDARRARQAASEELKRLEDSLRQMLSAAPR